MLDICAAIRQLKSERHITRKHVPKGKDETIIVCFIAYNCVLSSVYLHITDACLMRRLGQQRQDIGTLTQCSQIHILADPLTSLPADTLHRIVARSTAGPLCSFAIEVQDVQPFLQSTTPSDSVNAKKLQKLAMDLDRLQRTVASEGFKRSASAKVQQQHREKVSSVRLNGKENIYCLKHPEIIHKQTQIERITSELHSIQRIRESALT